MLKKLSEWLKKLHVKAYICIIAAIAGGFICKFPDFFMWYMLMFNCYTDITDMELYVFPIRLCIAAEIFVFFYKYGFCYENYVGLILCLVFVWIFRVFKLYAQGDMEIFFMLIMTAALKGCDIVKYSWRLVYGAMSIFCILFGFYIVVYNIVRKIRGERLERIKKAPMLPAIAISYLICLRAG